MLAALSAIFTTTTGPSLALADGAGAVRSKRAAASPVMLAEVATPRQPSAARTAGLREHVRKQAEAELAAIDWSGHAVARKYKLSASVTKLEGTRENGLAAASCTVTAAIRDAERGTLLAVVEGRARAEARPTAAKLALRDALDGAIRFAIGSVPEALRKLK